jgi:hypothetical protein
VILKPAVFKSLKFDAICLNVIFKGNLLKLILMLRYSQQSKCKGSCESKSPYKVVSTIKVTLVCNSAEVLFPLQPAFIFGFCTPLITVACRPVARGQLRKKHLYSSCYLVTALQTKEQCFLCGPCRDVVSRTVSESHLRVVVAEARDSLGTQNKGNVCHWKSLPSSGYGRLKRLYVCLRRLYMCCSYSDL